jgi:signal transduction histidine kinase
MLSSFILFTALGAQFIFILINWYFFRRKEYGYYLAYIVAVSAYYLNSYIANDQGMVDLFSFSYYTLYPDKIMAILSYVLYFKFGRHFVEAKTRYPQMNGHIVKAENILTAYILFDIVLLYVFNSFDLETVIFLGVNVCLSLFLIYIFWSMIKKNEILDRFIIYGSIFYAISASVTIWIGHHKSGADENGFMIVLQIGTLSEMIFLNAGIVYKSKMLQNQTIHSQRLLIERYRENQELLVRLANVREKLSRDLHDDVGATLSSIKAYSEILKDNPDNLLMSELINANSTDMIEKLEVIAWSTNPEHDNFRSLTNQMKKYAVPLCYSKNINCSIETPGINQELLIPGEVRQNVFLIFKEAVNNIIKYSEAQSCFTEIRIEDDIFSLCIEDDGKGFNGDIRGSGNGWKNMQKRSTELEGTIKIANGSERGMQIVLRFPFSIPNSWDKKQEAV